MLLLICSRARSTTGMAPEATKLPVFVVMKEKWRGIFSALPQTHSPNRITASAIRHSIAACTSRVCLAR